MEGIEVGNPRYGHAVINASFGVEFLLQPPGAIIPAATIRELLTLYPKLAEQYPRKREAQGQGISIASDSKTDEVVYTQISETVLAGFTFDSLFSDGTVERSITLDGNKLTINRSDYQGWSHTWDEVRSISQLMLPILMERLTVMAFHMQYTDRFLWKRERSEFRADMVFRRDSELLAPNVFEVSDLWHSYHGFFDYPTEPQPHQQLNVVEAQVGVIEGSKFAAQIQLRHRSIPGMTEAGGRGKVLRTVSEVLGEGDVLGLLDAYMNAMHDTDKQLLGRLINDEMCEWIGLTRSD